ncbi:MAG: alpha/beta hydrolase-fold protein [Myxococcota bacterium]
MDRAISTWFSPAVDREMSVARFGWFGKPVLLFPTGGGDFLEHERFLMIAALTPLIDAGRIKVYTVGNINRDGWINPDALPRRKTELQARFDQYLLDELLPFVKWDCRDTDQKFATAGASLGAFNAVTAVSKHPEWFDLAVTMSGTFDLSRWLNGYRDDDFYYNHPLDFLPNLGPSEQLDRLREARFVLGVGRGRWDNPPNSFRMARALAEKGVWNRVELWGPDADHDWPTWRTMLPMFLDRLVPAEPRP